MAGSQLHLPSCDQQSWTAQQHLLHWPAVPSMSCHLVIRLGNFAQTRFFILLFWIGCIFLCTWKEVEGRLDPKATLPPTFPWLRILCSEWRWLTGFFDIFRDLDIAHNCYMPEKKANSDTKDMPILWCPSFDPYPCGSCCQACSFCSLLLNINDRPKVISVF